MRCLEWWGRRERRERRLFASPKPVADPPDALRGPGEHPAPPSWVVTDPSGRRGGGDAGRGKVAVRRRQRKNAKRTAGRFQHPGQGSGPTGLH